MKTKFALLLSIVVLFVSCKKKANKEAEQVVDTLAYEETKLPFEEEFQLVDSSALPQGQDTMTDQVLTVDTATNSIRPIADEQVSGQTGKIYIIVGSFKNYENALKAKRYYERLGYSPQILPQVAGYNRVAIEEFTDLSTARARLQQLRQKFNRPDFWLLYKQSDF